VGAALDESLPTGIDVVEVVEATPGSSLPDRIEASLWRLRLPGVPPEDAEQAVATFLAEHEVVVERLTKNGMRALDARAAVVSLAMVIPDAGVESTAGDAPCATLQVVVRHVTPAVRPDDVLSGLRSAADLVPPVPPEATRLAQGPLSESGEVGDPLAPDRADPGADGGTRQDADRDRAVAGAPPSVG
jgi:hypothetical protein